MTYWIKVCSNLKSETKFTNILLFKLNYFGKIREFNVCLIYLLYT